MDYLPCLPANKLLGPWTSKGFRYAIDQMMCLTCKGIATTVPHLNLPEFRKHDDLNLNHAA